MFVGAAGVDAKGSDFPALAEEAGPFTIHRLYEKSGFPVTWAASVAGMDVGKGWGTVLSLKPDLAALKAGTLDAQITAFIESIPDSHLAYVTIWHEADAKIRQGVLPVDRAVYLDAFRRFCDLVHAVGKPRVFSTLIQTAWSGSGAQKVIDTKTTYADLWPGDGYVDVCAFDGYSDQPGNIWQPGVDLARSKNCRWAIAEIGCSGSINTPWMKAQAAYAASTGSAGTNSAEFLCWFSTTVGGVVATPGTDPAALATAREISIANYEPVYGSPAAPRTAPGSTTTSPYSH